MRISRKSAIAIGVFLVLGLGVTAAWWHEGRTVAPGLSSNALVVNVTSGADRGPGSLREALFVAAAADTDATISIQVSRVTLETTLPPLASTHGLSIVSQQPGAEIDASALQGTAVFDVAGARTSIEGIAIRNCRGAAILLRATAFRLQTTAISNCAVGVEIAENARDILLERNRFTQNGVGVRFAASSRNASVVRNEFSAHKDAGVWAVRSEPDLRGAAVSVRENTFDRERTGIVAGNVSILIERNDLTHAREAAIHIVGDGAVVRSNRISGGAAMGIVAENARGAIIDANELDHFTAYGIMVRGSSNTLVRNNRLHNCGYGMAFVLGDPRSPTTAVENTIIEPQFNGIDVVGDSPILRRNHVLRPRVMPLHVADFEGPDGKKVRAEPFLDNNSFGRANSSASIAASGAG